MGNPDLETILREDLSMAIQSKMFDDFLDSAGAANTNPVQGILPLITNNTALAVKDLTTAEKMWTLSKLESVVEKLFISYKANEMMARWIFSAKDKFLLRQSLKTSADTASNFLWEKDNSVCGYPAMGTNNLTDVGIIGDFRESYVATFGAMELATGYKADDFVRGITTLRAIMPWDVGVRRVAAFQKMTLDRS